MYACVTVGVVTVTTGVPSPKFQIYLAIVPGLAIVLAEASNTVPAGEAHVLGASNFATGTGLI
ncbi:hypothetical protein D3C78_1291320 [compost metagenome]